MLITLLGLNQKSAAGIFHHLVGAAVLDLEGLNGEHDQSIAQVPSIRHVSSGVPHRDLLEFWEIPGFPIFSVAHVAPCSPHNPSKGARSH